MKADIKFLSGLDHSNSIEILLGNVYKGDKGKSAYEIAVDNGFEGSEEEWLASLKVMTDTELSSTSDNAVANKAVTAAVSALNANTGISDYEEFSDQKEYKAGTTVLKDGLLYTFKVDHAAGAWNESQVKETNLKKEVGNEISELENNVFYRNDELLNTSSYNIPISEIPNGNGIIIAFNKSDFNCTQLAVGFHAIDGQGDYNSWYKYSEVDSSQLNDEINLIYVPYPYEHIDNVDRFDYTIKGGTLKCSVYPANKIIQKLQDQSIKIEELNKYVNLISDELQSGVYYTISIEHLNSNGVIIAFDKSDFNGSQLAIGYHKKDGSSGFYEYIEYNNKDLKDGINLIYIPYPKDEYLSNIDYLQYIVKGGNAKVAVYRGNMLIQKTIDSINHVYYFEDKILDENVVYRIPLRDLNGNGIIIALDKLSFAGDRLVLGYRSISGIGTDGAFYEYSVYNKADFNEGLNLLYVPYLKEEYVEDVEYFQYVVYNGKASVSIYPANKIIQKFYADITDLKKSNLNIEKFTNKKISIIADSISTFAGYVPNGYATWYPNTNSGITSVDKTWWHQLIGELGLTLLKNCSWSGSTVTGDTSSNDSAKCAASNKRINDCAEGDEVPSIIICFIGINDYRNDVQIGTFDISKTIPADGYITNFADAYAIMVSKIQKTYPGSRIFCCTLMDTNSSYPVKNGVGTLIEYNEQIKKISEALGVDIIDLHNCGINYASSSLLLTDGVHPNVNGAIYVKNKIKAELISKY